MDKKIVNICVFIVTFHTNGITISCKNAPHLSIYFNYLIIKQFDTEKSLVESYNLIQSSKASGVTSKVPHIHTTLLIGIPKEHPCHTLYRSSDWSAHSKNKFYYKLIVSNRWSNKRFTRATFNNLISAEQSRRRRSRRIRVSRSVSSRKVNNISQQERSAR